MKNIVGFLGLVLGLVGLSISPSLVIAQPGTNNGTTLRPGIIFDPAANVAYVMTPDGIAAIDLVTGAKQWTSSEAAKPLALAGHLLVSQVAPRSATSRLELVVLDTQERGAARVRSVAELPSAVRVSISQTLEGKFSAEARPVGNNAIVTWTFERLPMRGLVEESEVNENKLNNLTGPGRRTQAQTEGAVEMNLSTGALSPVSTTVSTLSETRRWLVTANEKISGAAPVQYESADGRHIMASERVADDRVWDKYRWTIFERATNTRVGEFRTHLSFAPFVVRNSTLIYETTPYIRAGREEPAKLRGVNLTSGQEIWGVEVRELVFRGPFPP